MPSATDLLREDHQKVKDLFRQFDEAEDKTEKKRIAEEAIMELEIHSQIEEEIFYPAVQRQDGEIEDMMAEAEEEHHVVDLLIAELKKLGAVNTKYVAKFTVLAENVKHHIQEEETEMLPKAAEEGMDRLMKLGDKMEKRKMELTASYGRRSEATRKPAARRTTSTNGTGRTATKPTTATRSTKAAARSTNGTGARSNGRKPTTTRTAAKATVRAAVKTGRAAAKTGRAAATATRTTVRKTASAVRSTARKAAPRAAATRSRAKAGARRR